MRCTARSLGISIMGFRAAAIRSVECFCFDRTDSRFSPSRSWEPDVAFLESLIADAGFKVAEAAYRSIRAAKHRSSFLNYDRDYLIGCYRDESDLAGVLLPYIEVEQILQPTWDEFQQTIDSLRVVKVNDPFVLAKHPPAALSDLQAHAYDQFSRETKMTRDDRVVRLVNYDPSTKTMTIQKCLYSDGIRSNYAMDWHGGLTLANSPISLRGLLQSQYDQRLPPWSECRMSNAIGLAVIVFVTHESGDVLPYLPLRATPSWYSDNVGATKRLGVYPGGFHCTASGEAAWSDKAASFSQLFTVDVCRELEEEVGLERSDLEWICPVGFCREFLRGGKPQLFFTAYTSLSPLEIGQRRRDAIKAQKKDGRQEIEDDVLVANTPEEFFRQLSANGTMEVVANMAFAQKCAALAYEAGKFGSGTSSA
jgi:hypothetical protein